MKFLIAQEHIDLLTLGLKARDQG